MQILLKTINRFLKLNLFVLFISLNAYSGPVGQHKYLGNISEQVSPSNTIFAFDLHEVVFNKIYKKIAYRTMFLIPNGMYRVLFNPFFWRTTANHFNKKIIWEDLYYRLIVDYPHLESVKDDFFSISNAVELIEETVEIIKELKFKGYKVFLLSNIGKKTYDRLVPDYKEIFELFDGVFIPGPENNYISKPKDKFYVEFKKYLENLGLKDKGIIFVDDIEKNLIPAYKLGISGILFKSAKGLNDILVSLNILGTQSVFSN